MLSRGQRLTGKRDFAAVYTGGKAYVHKLLVLKVRKKDGGQAARFGFSTSAKLGKAVVRNRMKRLLRESVHSLAGSVKESGFDAILIARPAARTANFAEIKEAVEELLQKARLV